MESALGFLLHPYGLKQKEVLTHLAIKVDKIHNS